MFCMYFALWIMLKFDISLKYKKKKKKKSIPDWKKTRKPGLSGRFLCYLALWTPVFHV